MQKYRLSIQGFVDIAVELNFRFPILTHFLPIRHKAFNNPPLVNVCWKFLEIWPLDIILYDDRFPIRIQLMVPHLQKIALSDTAVCIYRLSVLMDGNNKLPVSPISMIATGSPPSNFNSHPMLKNRETKFSSRRYSLMKLDFMCSPISQLKFRDCWQGL